MNSDESPAKPLIANVRLSVFDQTVQGEFALPIAAVRPESMLPIFHSLADVIVQVTAKAAGGENLTISCKKGCAACCRKLVAVSRIEARRISQLVAELPEPSRIEVQTRFADACRRILDAGLLEKLAHLNLLTSEELSAVGSEYFQNWISCPFLEQEACSIYADRPLGCREYVVTSPAEGCFPDSERESVALLNLPFRLTNALYEADRQLNREETEWVPLIMSLGWAERHDDEIGLQEASELLREVLNRLETSAKDSH